MLSTKAGSVNLAKNATVGELQIGKMGARTPQFELFFFAPRVLETTPIQVGVVPHHFQCCGTTKSISPSRSASSTTLLGLVGVPADALGDALGDGLGAVPAVLAAPGFAGAAEPYFSAGAEELQPMARAPRKPQGPGRHRQEGQPGRMYRMFDS